MCSKDIMKCILDAAMYLNNDNRVDAKESLRDAIELIDMQLYNTKETE